MVVSSNNLDIIKEALKNKNILVKNDEEIMKIPELTCDLIISYDLPQTAATYLQRVVRATQKALILLDSYEQNNLYPIETMLGRTIKQEIISGFEPEVIVEKKTAFTKSTKSQEKANEDEKKAQEQKDARKKEFKKSDKFVKKDKKPNKFLGKDENGKAIFSGKSGDRNHRHDGTKKDKVDSPKKTGRAINIKALKEKKEEK
jgi:superfamily II DNA/RNA helicase